MLLPSASGSSPHPPVSVYGTGGRYTIAAFPGSTSGCFPTLCSVHVTPPDLTAVFPSALLMRLYASSHSALILPSCVPAVLISVGAGISACCPSATSSDLALGPDFPRADQLYSGNLGYSAWEILTPISLLIPAFSLQGTPRLLIGTASPRLQCSSTNHLAVSPQLRWCVSAPEIFGAGPLDQ